MQANFVFLFPHHFKYVYFEETREGHKTARFQKNAQQGEHETGTQ